MTPRLVSASKLLRRLEWRLEHEVENRLVGEYFSVFRGRGMEFDQVVKYEYGDDIRDIDWNVTARLGEPYRKKFVEERELVVMLVIEDSLSLQFGSGTRTKREALFELAALVMLLAALNRDAIGVLHVQPGGYHLTERVRGRSAVVRSAAWSRKRAAVCRSPLIAACSACWPRSPATMGARSPAIWLPNACAASPCQSRVLRLLSMR